jgi:hypothetical protein
MRFVQVWSGMSGDSKNWDNHSNIHAELPFIARSVDQPIAALLRVLKDHGLLADTLVVGTSEFGRMPLRKAPRAATTTVLLRRLSKHKVSGEGPNATPTLLAPNGSAAACISNWPVSQPFIGKMWKNMTQAKAGDEAALAELFGRYRKRLRQMVRLRLDRRLQGRVDPSDLLQEAYLDASRKLPSYSENENLLFFLWLRLVVGQKLTDLHRHHLGVQLWDRWLKPCPSADRLQLRVS